MQYVVDHQANQVNIIITRLEFARAGAGLGPTEKSPRDGKTPIGSWYRITFSIEVTSQSVIPICSFFVIWWHHDQRSF